MPKDADFGPSPLGSFAKCVRASLPRLNYASLYLGTVIAHNQPAGSTLSTLDVVVDDPGIPPMQGVPLMNGLPGLVLKTLPVGAAVLVGWSESDPARPFCCTFGGGERVGAMTLNADQLTLGGDAGAEPTIKGTSYRAAESALHQSWIATLGGMASASTGPLAPLAAGFTALATALTTFEAQQATFLATNVKVK